MDRSTSPSPLTETINELRTMLDRFKGGALPVEEFPFLLGRMETVRETVRLQMAAPSPLQAPDNLLDAQEAAQRLKMSKDWLYANAKELPFVVHMGSALRFSERGIEAYIRGNCSRNVLTARQHKRNIGLVG
jgi:predicted DNA-binding transcriptional regulator AlpA